MSARQVQMLRAGIRSGLVLPGLVLAGLGLPSCLCSQQSDIPQPLVESGQTLVDGQTLPYRIHRLPVASFPDLPPAVVEALHQRQCLVPQTYAAHHPENVVHASLERAGSSDWAVLCSAAGTVSLLAFFASAPGSPMVLTSAPETHRLQRHDASGILGFDWAIDPASPSKVRATRSGEGHNLPPLDHDALADSSVDGRTIYRVYVQNSWKTVAASD